MLSLHLAGAGADEIAVEARILDLRKRGLVGIGGVVNGPGVVHDMVVRLRVSRSDLAVRAAELAMRAVPFPGGAHTAGESCRDNERRFAAVVGLRLGQGFLSGLQRSIGGARGCFHVFTLLRLLGPSIVWATSRDLHREEGRSFSRTVWIDGVWEEPVLRLRAALTDLRYAPGSAERVVELLEGQAEAQIGVPGVVVGSLAASYRAGAPEVRSPWTTAGLEQLGTLAGSSLLRGYGLAVDHAVSPRGPLAPMRELLLMLQPVAFQCMPSLADAHGAAEPGRRGGPLAARDSCAMWRHDGPLMAEMGRRPDAWAH
jgi:hypothetical protein